MNTLEQWDSIDAQFQNAKATLRLAPWLDMPRLRSKVQEDITARVEAGAFDGHYPQFKSDLLSFCANESHCAPRSSAIIDILGDVLHAEFHEYSSDARPSRALRCIGIYLLQNESWSTNNTLESEKERAEEAATVGEDARQDRPDLPF